MTYPLNKSESISFIRKVAKNNGLTFRVHPRLKINGGPAYQLINRKSKEVVMDNYVFSSAFNDACSGYIDSWNGSEFKGI